MVGENEREIRMLRYGSADPLPERHALRAGPITAVLEDGGLRCIRYGRQEIVRGIYAAVRDQNWGTVKPEFTRYEVLPCNGRGDSFEVRFMAEHRNADIDFQWEGTITGTKEGAITFTFDGVARRAFQSNRIGFCILHPADLAGCPAEVLTPEGTVSGLFPDLISPQQPFKDIIAIRQTIQIGLAAELQFHGELFEMEDQRNWTDASFKTYCTPLERPFPVEITEGQRVRQSVELRLIGEAEPSPAANAAAYSKPADTVGSGSLLAVDVEDRPIGRVPQIGLSVTPGGVPSPQQAAALQELRVSFLRTTVRLSAPGWEQELNNAAATARMLDTGLELEVIAGEGEDAGLGGLLHFTAANKIPVEALFAFPQAGYTSSGELLSRLIALRDQTGHYFLAGGGTRAYFAEFNRASLPLAHMEAAMYTLNPQVHAFDVSSIAETVSAQAATVRSARAIVGSVPLSIGPVTFKPRLNPNAASEEAARLAEDRSTHTDPRQWSLFGAGWTIGSLRSLAEAGADRVSYFETVGPLGVLREGTSPAIQAYPLYHILAAAGQWQGAELLSCRVEDRLSGDAMAVRRSDGKIAMMLANYTNAPLQVRVVAPAAFHPATLRVMDERSILRVPDHGVPAAKLESRLIPPVKDGCFELTLLPFACGILEE